MHHPPDPDPTHHTLRDPEALIAAGLADPADRAALAAVAARYAIAIPPTLRGLIGQPGDPLHRQFVPDPAELVTAAHEHPDPIGDDALSPVKGVVRRYPDRALLKPLLACPVYCRYCFRREHVGPDGGLLSPAELDAACAWLAAQPELREIILTGGEPLLLSPRRLEDLLARLGRLAQIELLRVHTRMPIAMPERMTDALVAALAASPRPLWLVVHVNHASELSPPALESLARLRLAGIPLLAQSVLLRGVNDDADTLATLFRALLAARVKPYYLHQLDSAPGTARFHVPIARGLALMAALRGRIGGHALPSYVLDIPGGHGKMPLAAAQAEAGASITDPWGKTHELAGPDATG